jgi:WD40 repeat protein
MMRWVYLGLVVMLGGSASSQEVLPALGGLPVAANAQRPAQRVPPAPMPGPNPNGRPSPGARAVRPPAPTPAGPLRLDRCGDPLPPGAIARFGTVRLRHGGEIAGLGFTPDGKRLATVSATEEGIRLWDPATGKEVARLTIPLTAVALARDGSVVILEGARCKIWQPIPGNPIRELPSGSLPETTSTLTIHPNSRMIAVGTPGKVLQLDLSTGKILSELKAVGDQPPSRLTYSPDGRWLAGTAQKTGIWVWDLKTGRRVRTYPVTTDLCEFAFSPDGTHIAIASETLRTYLLDAEEPDETFEAHNGPFSHIRFSPDGKWLDTQAPDGISVRLDAVTGAVKATWPLPVGVAVNPPLALSPDATFAAGVDDSGGIRIWCPQTGKGPEIDRLPVLREPGYLADGKTVSCLDSTGHLRTFDPLTGKPGEVFTISAEPGLPVVWDTRGERAAIIAGDEDETEIRIVSGFTGKILAKFPAPATGPSIIAFCPSDPDRLLVVSPGSVMIVRISTGGTIGSFLVGQPETPQRGVFSPDGRLIAISTSPLTLWEVRTGKKRFEFETIEDPAGMVFSPDGRLLAAWEGGGVVVFDVRTGTVVRRFRYPGAETMVSAAAFSLDGKRLAIGTADGSITLWETLTGEPVLSFDRHEGIVTGLLFSQDGAILISTGADGTALVWDTAAKPDLNAAVTGSDEALRLLASADPAIAQRGMAYLYRQPRDSVRLLEEKIPVPNPVPAERIKKLVRDLGSEDYQTRKAAVGELMRIGGEAGPLVREAAKSPSPEVAKLTGEILGIIDGPPTRPDDLRSLRAAEVLEVIGTSEARAVLTKWAAGPPAHRQTVEATGALARLKSSQVGEK